MDSFLSFIVGWGLVGCGVNFTVQLIETIIAVKKHRPVPRFRGNLLVLLVMWPVTLLGAAAAYSSKKSLFAETGEPSMTPTPGLDFQWRNVPTIEGATCQALVVKDSQGSPQLSHAITHVDGEDGRYFCWRYCVEADEHVALSMAGTKKLAMSLCEGDSEWHRVRLLGDPKKELSAFKALQEKLGEPEDEDEA